MLAITGATIGAKLLTQAGSLRKLVEMPASTIQLLGAEKALFRFKKEGGKPPKHGVIFQHPLINRAPREERGRIARIFSGKIALAVKADVFTKRNIADILKAELDQRLKDVRNQ